jgi:ABC-2 type transport system permease protein
MFFLQLRNEIWKLFGKKRTYIGFGMFLIAQNIIIVVHRLPRVRHQISQLLEHNGFMVERYISVLTISTLMVSLMALTLMPLYTALVGGDLVAKEAEDGTLRMILSRPISRVRLLLLKWLTGAIFSFLLVMSLGLFGLIFTSFWFPWGDLFTLPGVLSFGVFSAARGLECYVIAHCFMVPSACTMLTLAFMFSCFNMKPAAATILALSIMFISMIMQDIPFFVDYRPWFITYDMGVWRDVFAEKIPWWKVGEAFSFLLAYNVSFLVVGCTAFQMRDIKS